MLARLSGTSGLYTMPPMIMGSSRAVKERKVEVTEESPLTRCRCRSSRSEPRFLPASNIVLRLSDIFTNLAKKFAQTMTRLQNGITLYNQEVHKIHISDQIRNSGLASPELIAEAVTYLHRDGILVLENAVAAGHLDELEHLLVPEAEDLRKNPAHHFNWNKGNMDQAPPLIPKLMFQDIWANPIVTSICSNILGPEIVCHYANGNTAMKSTARQPVHADIDKPHPMFPFAYAINIPLCDVSVENGSTEIWVGSHRESSIDQHETYATGETDLTIKSEILEERRQHSPPIQPPTKRGSIIIRDIRLFHAGMPNLTAIPRIMLAFVIQPKWFQAPSKVLLPLKAKALVDEWRAKTGLEYAAQWIDGEVDHRLVSSDEVDFSTRNSKLLELDALMRAPLH